MRVISRIKEFIVGYLRKFKKKKCPWCEEECIPYWRVIRLQHSDWDLSSLRKRECPNCKKKLTVKSPRWVKICDAVFLVLIIITIILDCKNIFIIETIDFSIRVCIIVAYLLFVVIPNHIVEKDTKYEELAIRQRKREEAKEALCQSADGAVVDGRTE